MKARPWTIDEDRIVFDLWSDGMSASEIGAEVGRTKSAIISRIHRIAPDTVGHTLGAIQYARPGSVRGDPLSAEPAYQAKMRIWERARKAARIARQASESYPRSSQGVSKLSPENLASH